MSSAPAQEKPCPLDLENNLLEGGYILDQQGGLYVYIYVDNGVPSRAMIASVDHKMARPSSFPKFDDLYDAVDNLFSNNSHNFYWNVGWPAGRRVKGHAHAHFDPRPNNEPASGMGPRLVRQRFNKLVARIDDLARRQVWPHDARSTLHQAINEATML